VKRTATTALECCGQEPREKFAFFSRFIGSVHLPRRQEHQGVAVVAYVDALRKALWHLNDVGCFSIQRISMPWRLRSIRMTNRVDHLPRHYHSKRPTSNDPAPSQQGHSPIAVILENVEDRVVVFSSSWIRGSRDGRWASLACGLFHCLWFEQKRSIRMQASARTCFGGKVTTRTKPLAPKHSPGSVRTLSAA
jgi:hypothetical protein